MRQLILEAAIAAFALGGYAATSNRDIAARGGVTSGLLYHYFDSKAALFREALKEVNARLLCVYRSACDRIPDAPSLEQLVQGMRDTRELTAHQPLWMRFAGHAEAEIQRHPELALSIEEGRDDFMHFFRDLLLRARQRGELGSGVDVEAGVRVMSAFMTRLATISGATDQGGQELAQHMAVFESMLRGQFLRDTHSPP